MNQSIQETSEHTMNHSSCKGTPPLRIVYLIIKILKNYEILKKTMNPIVSLFNQGLHSFGTSAYDMKLCVSVFI